MYKQPVNFRIGGPVTPVVKQLLFINISVFIIQWIMLNLFHNNLIAEIFGLSHEGFILQFKLWQPFTYMFLHGGWLHLIFNMIAIWMFAGELEEKWGSRAFLKYYIYSGIGAGIFIALVNWLTYTGINSPYTVGASGAIYGILLAYGMTWPNREVLLYFVLPIKIKYLVLIFGLMGFLGTVSNILNPLESNISHIGHLGGLIAGYIIIKYRLRKYGLNNKTVINQYLRKRKLNKHKELIENRIKAKKIIDTMLVKIAKNGMQSLSSKEKRDLEWARQNYHHDKNEPIH